MVKEKDGLAKPFFIEENDFGTDADNFYNADKNNFAPRLSAVYQLTDKTALRAGYGHFYGPGQFEDRIQPIENYIERRRVQNDRRAEQRLAYPVDPAIYRNLLSVRGYTHERPDEYNVQYGVSVSQELPGAVNLTVGYTGSHGKDMFLRGVANTLRQRHARAAGARRSARSTTRRRAASTGWSSTATRSAAAARASYDALQIGADAPLPRRPDRRPAVSVLAQRGHDAGLERGGDGVEHVRLQHRVRHEPDRHPAHVQRLADLHAARSTGRWTGGWRVGGIVNARSGVPINVTISRPDTVPVGGVTVTNIPGGNSRGTQRPDLVPGVDPYLKDGVRWLNPAAFAAPMPGTFGNLPRNYLRGPGFWQLDLIVEQGLPLLRRNQGLQIRVEIFNITNRLNYENPAAILPAGTVGQPFTDAVAGTFGYMLGPLNRTVGLGTARQTQVSVRFLF